MVVCPSGGGKRVEEVIGVVGISYFPPEMESYALLIVPQSRANTSEPLDEPIS